MPNPFNDSLSHALKHSGNDVYGLLVSNTSDPKRVCGCLPLFHSRLVSVPMLRVALSIVDELPNIRIVALYCASEVYANRIPPVAKWILSQIRETLKRNDIICVQFSEKLVEDGSLNTWPFKVVDIDKTESGELPFDVSYDANEFKQSLQHHTYTTAISDFEDHMNNHKEEWIRISR